MSAERDVEARLMCALGDVLDPELPISIVDMGLVVGLHYRVGEVFLQITFTAMGCPATEMILDDVRERLMREPDVRSVHVEIVWEPSWNRTRLTEEGRAQLLEWGISV